MAARAPDPAPPKRSAHPVILLVTMTLVFSAVLMVGVQVYEPLADDVKDRVDADSGDDVDNILKAVLQYSVPLFLFTIFGWGMIWYLRRERQTVRR